jgi:nucleoporin NUP159
MGIDALTSVSWSTKGKQIAIATSNADILQYSPAEPAEARATIPRAQGPDLNGTVPLLIQWLSNSTFHVIYAEPRSEASLDDYEPQQHNYIVTFDKRSNQVTDIQLPLPWDPYGLTREPGHQTATLRSWGRYKHLLFVNDAHASDVGIIGCIGDSNSAEDSGNWAKISLGDDSITFPLSSDMDETSLIGMGLDLSAEKPLLGASQANGDDATIPPAPILYMLTNDAVVIAFHIVNEDGVPYPGMASATGTGRSADIAMEQTPTQATTQIPVQVPVEPAPKPMGFAGFASTNTPAFGQSGFGSKPAAPTFGSTGFVAPTTCKSMSYNHSLIAERHF